ncbi:hypothetical protein PR048_017169 [Dryococelus australis]|uniref:Acyltransferase 3 domain-containing protein n=1 Tax=Dryococelus australis TaxID=614101 RepID=A0ABQ9H8S4_9NEOP|nr:hypothetical protein PR048_017169 [Dryococelus australis]
MVFFYATLLYRMGDGPIWGKLVGTQRDLCVNGWWTNLLYVNNILDGSKDMCMKPSWYLAVDMQLYLFSPLVLYPLWRWPRAGVTLLVLALAASIATPAAIAAVYRLPGQLPLRLIGAKNIAEDMLYYPSFARASPYLLGVAFGYWLNTIKDKEIVLPKWAVAAGWTCSLAAMAAALQGAQGIVLETHHVSMFEASAYAGFARFVWSCGLVWLVFACIYGYGEFLVRGSHVTGLVNSILSMRVMQPLSKLSYCIYLSHWAVLLWRAGSKTNSEYFSMYILASVLPDDRCVCFDFLLTSGLGFDPKFCLALGGCEINSALNERMQFHLTFQSGISKFNVRPLVPNTTFPG